MKLNSHYNFKEMQLGKDFAKEKMAEFEGLINSSQSFTVLSMPGVGVSYFLKYLTGQDFARFFHIDIYSLPALTQREFYKLLFKEITGEESPVYSPSEEKNKSDDQIFKDCQTALAEASKREGKIVLIFSRFDQLKKQFTKEFFSNIQSLTTIAPGQIVSIFTSVLPLYELAAEAVTGGNLSFYSKTLYFRPYSKDELVKLFTLDHTLKAHPEIEKMAEIAGGHSQLLHIFMNSHKKNNLLLDKFVTLQLKDLINYLDYQQKKQVQKIALRQTQGKLFEVDEYLLGVGMVKRTNGKFELFTPLLSEYLRLNLPVKLPVKEARLFKLLRSKMGSVVTKDEIFNEVWGEGDGGATDWALDALIYRLRKHPFMQTHGYIIESHKKVGYTLIQT